MPPIPAKTLTIQSIMSGTPFPHHSCFELCNLSAHTDYFMKLDIPQTTSLALKVAFKALPYTGGISVVKARVIVYASLVEEVTPIRYRYQTSIDESSDAETEHAVYSWGEVGGTVRFCCLSSTPLESLTLTCSVGVSVPRGEDLCQIWKIASLVTPDVEDMTSLKQWLWERHSLLMASRNAKEIFDENGLSPFHHNAQQLGSPATCQLMLQQFKRLVCPERVDTLCRSPLHLLCMNTHLNAEKENATRYKRACAILKLLINDGECAVNLIVCVFLFFVFFW